MQVTAQHGSNRSVSMQSGIVSDVETQGGTTTLSLTTVRLPKGGTADILVLLEKSGEQSRCALTLTP